MRKVALIFLLAVFAPSLVLAWLAVRSVRDQQVVLERQQMLLYQGAAAVVARDVAEYILALQRDFAEQVRQLRSEHNTGEIAEHFDESLRAAWPFAEVGFAVSLDGNIYSPSLFGGPEARKFRLENDRFLCSREPAEVYFSTTKGSAVHSKAVDRPRLEPKGTSNAIPETRNADVREPGGILAHSKEAKLIAARDIVASLVEPGEAEFRQLVSREPDGIVARFLQNRLKVLIWHRASPRTDIVFGAQINLDHVIDGLRSIVAAPESLRDSAVFVLMDDMDRPVHSAPAADLTWPLQPWVTAEVGPVLPHWKVAVSLLDPGAVGRSATTLKWTLSLIVLLMMAAIAAGGALLFLDLRGQLLRARQKTDFVSNVSHELKTPLTSIRMFSELLNDGHIDDERQRKHFLGIIGSEAARLTRLINNVLDFSRMERGEKKYYFQPCDLRQIVIETVESFRLPLEAGGFNVMMELPAGPVKLQGDCDALAQVLVNLLSNAEKYAPQGGEVTVALQPQDTVAEVRVMDRGPGVPRGCEDKIFEQFYRANDSLSSGIQGSGLGLTLAQQIARAHHGELRYEVRSGGGSAFVLTLPLDQTAVVSRLCHTE